MHVKVRQRSKAKTFMQKKVPHWQAESRRAHWHESSPQTVESKHVERVRCDTRHHHAFKLPTGHGVGRNGGVL